jgi:hypothetical protein
MKRLILTKELFNCISDECEAFQAATWPGNDVDPNDVLYSFFNSTPEQFAILSDWDEGKENDPFWNDELNEHSAIVFIRKMVDKLNALK